MDLLFSFTFGPSPCMSPTFQSHFWNRFFVHNLHWFIVNYLYIVWFKHFFVLIKVGMRDVGLYDMDSMQFPLFNTWKYSLGFEMYHICLIHSNSLNRTFDSVSAQMTYLVRFKWHSMISLDVKVNSNQRSNSVSAK